MKSNKSPVAQVSSPCARSAQGKNRHDPHRPRSLCTGWKPVPRLSCLVLIVATFLTCVASAQGPATKPAPVVLPASVEAFDVADQFAKVAGYVSDVKADIGDHVKQGQVLATIDVPELVQELAEAKATLGAKQKLQTAAQASVVQAQKMLEVAK